MIKKLTFFSLLGLSLPLVAQTSSTEDVGKITVKHANEDEITKLTHSPMPVSVIDVSKFHGRNISLNEILKRVAGVRVKQQGGLGSATTIAVQGLEGKRVKIYIDGAPLNAPDGTFGINDIPIQFIERIEVYKGVVPAKFGGDATGGAVNVVIKELDESYIDFTNSLGFYGEHRMQLAMKKKFEKYDLTLGLGGFYNKAANDYVMNSPYVDGLRIKRDHDGFKSYLGGFVGDIRDKWFDKISWELVHYESEKEIQGIKTPIKNAEDKSTLDVGVFKFEKEKFFNDNLAFEYTMVLANLELNHIDNARTCYNFDGSVRECPGSGQGEITGLPHDSKDKQKELRHDLNLHYLINNDHGLNFHLNSQNSKYEPNDPLADQALGFDSGKYPSESTNTVLSLGLESTFLGNKIVNDMGVKNYRYDYQITPGAKLVGVQPKTNEHKGDEIGFYESIRYEPIPDLFIKASYEHAYRLPNNTEIFGDGSFIDPSPNLIPEEADNFNVGILFDRFDFYSMPWVKLEANLFYKKLKNMIKLQQGDNTAGYINLGQVEVKGFEFEVGADLTDNWYFYANYTNQTLLDKQKTISGTNGVPSPTYNLDIPNVAKQYGNIGVEYKTLGLFRADSLFKVFWETLWADEYYYGYELSRFQSRKIDEQVSHTAGFEYSFKDDRYILGFEVRNLTDEETTDVFNYPLMGRTAHLNMRYTFIQ